MLWWHLLRFLLLLFRPIAAAFDVRAFAAVLLWVRFRPFTAPPDPPAALVIAACVGAGFAAWD